MKLKTKFQDEDFKVGEVVEARVISNYNETTVTVMADIPSGGTSVIEYNSIKSFTDDWEDAPEDPKEHWAIDQFGEPINVSGLNSLQLEKLHRLGNDFPSENAVMKAVERLHAWKRLKDKGFKFEPLWDYDGGNLQERIRTGRILFRVSDDSEIDEDLDLLFGGKE